MIKEKLQEILENFPELLREGISIVENPQFCVEVRAVIFGGLVYFILGEDLIPDNYENGYIDDFFVFIFAVELADEFSPLLDEYLHENKVKKMWFEVTELLRYLEEHFPSFYHKMKKSLNLILQFRYDGLRVKEYFYPHNKLKLESVLKRIKEEIKNLHFSEEQITASLENIEDTIFYLEKNIDHFLASKI